MFKPLFSLLALAAAAVQTLPAQQVYLSPDGDDAGSGTEAEPLYSLTAARDLIRRLPAGGDTVTVWIAPGTYRMTEPLILDGNDVRPVVFRSRTAEKPVFSGGIEVTGWTPWRNGIWRTRLPETLHFEQFYVNGRRAVRARTPDTGWYYVKGSRETVLDRGTGRAPQYAVQRIAVEPDELSPLRRMSREELRHATALFYHKWDVTRKPIDHAVPDSGWFFISGEGMKPWNPITDGSRYVLDNYLGALDSPGEWYLSPDGWLYYMPREGESMAAAECYAPTLSRLLVFAGSPDRPVAGKEFRNIAFRTSAYTMPLKGNEPMQAAAEVPAAIEADYASRLVFADCEVTQTGGYAFWLRRECFDNRIEHCLIEDLGAGGIKIGETEIRMDGRPVTARNTVDNNIIRHGGYWFPCAVGVAVFQAADNRVTHNEIADMRYSGISVGWKWGYNDQKTWITRMAEDGTMQYAEVLAGSPAVGNRIEFNHVHHIGWAELSDMGAVYTLGESPGTVVSNNVIHDIYSYDYGGWGLYTDEGSTGIVMENNLVYRCKSGGFHQHYGKENVIRNNIFALAYQNQLQFTRVEPHRSFAFERNIVLSDRGVLLSGPWREADIAMDRNDYWDLRADTALRFCGLPFREWRRIKDARSVVADPMFRDPEAGDFTFRSLKTARRIGFVPFDYTQAGVYGSAEWKERARLDETVTGAFAVAVETREAHYKAGAPQRSEQ